MFVLESIVHGTSLPWKNLRYLLPEALQSGESWVGPPEGPCCAHFTSASTNSGIFQRQLSARVYRAQGLKLGRLKISSSFVYIIIICVTWDKSLNLFCLHVFICIMGIIVYPSGYALSSSLWSRSSTLWIKDFKILLPWVLIRLIVDVIPISLPFP